MSRTNTASARMGAYSRATKRSPKGATKSMGYTHYWYREQKIAPDVFKAIVSDFEKVRPHLHVELAGGQGEGEPTFNDVTVDFNGVGDDSHETFRFDS